MHALEEDTQEVVQRDDERVGPLSREVGSEDVVCVWGRLEGQSEPGLPFSLILEFCGLLCKEFLGLVIFTVLWVHAL